MPTPAMWRARRRLLSIPATLRSSTTMVPCSRTSRVDSWCSPSRRAFATAVWSVAMRAWVRRLPLRRRPSRAPVGAVSTRGLPLPAP